MTAERTHLLRLAEIEIHRSMGLIRRTRRVCANAAMIRRVTAQQRQKTFAPCIAGGTDIDGVSEQAIREKLVRGTLPRFAATKIQYSRGERNTCAACGLVIGEHHVEVHADFDLVLAGRRMTLRFHPACFNAWQKEMRALVA